MAQVRHKEGCSLVKTPAGCKGRMREPLIIETRIIRSFNFSKRDPMSPVAFSVVLGYNNDLDLDLAVFGDFGLHAVVKSMYIWWSYSK